MEKPRRGVQLAIQGMIQQPVVIEARVGHWLAAAEIITRSFH